MDGLLKVGSSTLHGALGLGCCHVGRYCALACGARLAQTATTSTKQLRREAVGERLHPMRRHPKAECAQSPERRRAAPGRVRRWRDGTRRRIRSREHRGARLRHGGLGDFDLLVHDVVKRVDFVREAPHALVQPVELRAAREAAVRVGRGVDRIGCSPLPRRPSPCGPEGSLSICIGAPRREWRSLRRNGGKLNPGSLPP